PFLPRFARTVISRLMLPRATRTLARRLLSAAFLAAARFIAALVALRITLLFAIRACWRLLLIRMIFRRRLLPFLGRFHPRLRIGRPLALFLIASAGRALTCRLLAARRLLLFV